MVIFKIILDMTEFKMILYLMIFRFIGEESVAAGEKCQMTDKKTWIIDPIDGTTNFIHSNPQICTILAFMVDKVRTMVENTIETVLARWWSSLLCTTLYWTSSGLLGEGRVQNIMGRR